MRGLTDIVMMVGGITLLAGAVMHITGSDMSMHLYCGGTLMFAMAQLSDRYDGDNLTIRRLRGQQVLGAIFLLLSGLMMYAERWHTDIVMNMQLNDTLRSLLGMLTARNGWIATMSFAAIFELYSSLRLDHELKKEKDNLGDL